MRSQRYNADCEKCALLEDALASIVEHLEDGQEAYALDKARDALERASDLSEMPAYRLCPDCGKQLPYASQGVCRDCFALGRWEQERNDV